MVVDLGPDSPAGQAAVGGDVEGRELLAVGLGDDQRRVVGLHCHAVREREAVGHLAGDAIGRHQGDDARRELAPRKVEPDVVDVGVAPTVDDDVVPWVLAQGGQIGMRHQRTVGLLAQKTPVRRRDDQQPPVGQVVDAHRERSDAGDHLALARRIDGDDLVRAPVGDPQPAVVPPRRLGEGQAGEQDVPVATAVDVHPVLRYRYG